MPSVFRSLPYYIFVVLLAAPPAEAETDFNSMPVGCSWTTQYSDGQTLTETFLGKKSGRYVTKVTMADQPRKVVRFSYFDRKGRLVRKDWAGGKWEKFEPYSCFGTLGQCTYRYSNADGADQTILNDTRQKGVGYVVVAAPKGEPPYPDEYFETGPYGLMTKNRASNYSAELIRLENCDASLS
jgi:hypothetical protein